jgi:hypothetical protein
MNNLSRRRVTFGVAAVGAAAVGATWIKFYHPFGAHYAPTPYDDVLEHLDDRAAAIRLGRVALAGMPDFNLKAAVAKLRTRFWATPAVANSVLEDARAGHLQSVSGWVMPRTLVLLCAVAAKVE